MSMNTPPTVWKDGKFVDDVDHLAGSGNPQVQDIPQLGEEWQPMPLEDRWRGVVDGYTLGINERLREGRHEAQAWALCVTDVETILESPIYGLVPLADLKPFDPFDTMRPIPVREMTGAAAVERAERRAAVRATMKPDEKSPLDLIQIARELRADAVQKERQWARQLEAFAVERKLDEDARVVYLAWERGKKLLERERRAASK